MGTLKSCTLHSGKKSCFPQDCSPTWLYPHVKVIELSSKWSISVTHAFANFSNQWERKKYVKIEQTVKIKILFSPEYHNYGYFFKTFVNSFSASSKGFLLFIDKNFNGCQNIEF